MTIPGGAATRCDIDEFAHFMSASAAGLVALADRSPAAARAYDNVFQRALNWVAGSAPQRAAVEWRAAAEAFAAREDSMDGVPRGDVVRAGLFSGAVLDRMDKAEAALPCRARVAVSGTAATGCDLSPDGSTVAVACHDWDVVLLDSRTWRERARLKAHRAAVRGTIFTRDGTLLVSCSDDKTLVCWDVATGTVRATMRGHAKGVNAAAWLGLEGPVVSASDDATLGVWNPLTGKRIGKWVRQHSRPVTSVAATVDGRLVASGSWDASIIVWDVTTSGRGDGQAATLTTFRQLKPHTSAVQAVAWAPTTVRKLATAAFDGTVCVIDVEAGHVVATLRGHLGPVANVSFNSDGTRLVSSGSDGTLRLWRGNAAGGQLRLMSGHTQAVTACTVAPSATWARGGCEAVVSVGADGDLRAWTLPSTTAQVDPDPRTPVRAGAVGLCFWWCRS